jgi:hypothetical protein
MKSTIKHPAFFAFIIIISIALFAFEKKRPLRENMSIESSAAMPLAGEKVQVAILLDVSGSMDGLIEQAKSQLWSMVNVLGKSKCGSGEAPKIEIALYEYGRTNNDAKKGYVKQINGFISDLDSLSENLFKLTTNGGEEFCGEVIYQSVDDLVWDKTNNTYKTIFIAGNEDFLQGSRKFTDACALAKNKGIIVNTIYCGDKMTGIQEHWNLGGECGNGSYSNINSNAKLQEFDTPYDSVLIAYNTQLNGTYVTYGSQGYAKQAKQASMDKANASLSEVVVMKRIEAKANKAAYRNADWDAVDAVVFNGRVSGIDVKKLDVKTLPDSLQKLNTEQLTAFIQAKANERALIQKNIGEASRKREEYIANERKRLAQTNSEATLETAVEQTIKLQGAKFGLVF